MLKNNNDDCLNPEDFVLKFVYIASKYCYTLQSICNDYMKYHLQELPQIKSSLQGGNATANSEKQPGQNTTVDSVKVNKESSQTTSQNLINNQMMQPPKKPESAFVQFITRRTAYHVDNPKSDSNMKASDIAALVQKEWQELDKDKKVTLTELAKKQVELWQKQILIYNKAQKSQHASQPQPEHKSKSTKLKQVQLKQSEKQQQQQHQIQQQQQQHHQIKQQQLSLQKDINQKVPKQEHEQNESSSSSDVDSISSKSKSLDWSVADNVADAEQGEELMSYKKVKLDPEDAQN